MRFNFICTAALIAATAAPIVALAEERATRDEAKAMVDEAISYVKKVGPEQAYKDFSDKSNLTWHKKDLYVVAIRMDGLNVAHGANEKLLGKNLLDLKDQNGKAFLQEWVAVAKKGNGTGWVSYDWPHPITKKVEAKESYVSKIPSTDALLVVGTYVLK